LIVARQKHRWNESHEIIHSLLEWHQDMMLGDSEQELTPACHVILEAEANYGAGQLLFLRNRFTAEARSSAPDFEIVRALNKRFGNTMTSTLWRYVESAFPDRPMLGVVSVHPHRAFRPDDFNPLEPCRYFIRSAAFIRQFPHVTETDAFAILESYCAPRRGGPLRADELTLTDANGDVHLFAFKTFYNRHDALTLAVYLRPIPTMVQVASIAGAI
jgi:hypothetical protein